jgi:hypothetical protein
MPGLLQQLLLQSDDAIIFHLLVHLFRGLGHAAAKRDMLSLFTCFEDLDKILLMCLCRDQSINQESSVLLFCWQLKYYELNYRCYTNILELPTATPKFTL